jgi:hypothetical protein
MERSKIMGTKWQIRSVVCFDFMNEKSQIIKGGLYSEETERKNIGNHKRSDRTAEKHQETEATQKSRKQFQTPSPVLWRGRGKLKTITR